MTPETGPKRLLRLGYWPRRRYWTGVGDEFTADCHSALDPLRARNSRGSFRLAGSVLSSPLPRDVASVHCCVAVRCDRGNLRCRPNPRSTAGEQLPANAGSCRPAGRRLGIHLLARGQGSPPEPGCQDLSASGHDSVRSIPDAPRSQLAEADHSGDAGFVPVPEQKGCIGSGR